MNGTISLRQAKAPLTGGEARFELEAGVGIRGAIRRAATKAGVDWFEEKSWLDSYFVFRGPYEATMQLYLAVRAAEKETD